MRHSIKALCGIGVIAAGLFTADSARANLIPTLISGSPTVGPVISGTQYYTWTYDVSLSAGENLQTNNFVTIYDTVGLKTGSEVTPAGWTALTPERFLGVDGPGSTPLIADSSKILNVTYIYTASTTLDGQPNGLDLGHFSFLSTDNIVNQGAYTSEGIKNTGTFAGTVDGNTGYTEVPVVVSVGTGVPLPAALPVGLALLAGIGLKRKLALK
jgi:hypothetical protein